MVNAIKTDPTSLTVSTIKVPMERTQKWEQWVLLSADRHFDNPKSDIKMQKKHLQRAVERNAFVLDFGDLFCAMQGKYDPRSCKDDLSPETANGTYIDSLVDEADKLFSPFAENIALLGYGNHETNVLKRHETDLTKRLVDRLKTKNPDVLLGGYRGWIRLIFKDNTHSKAINIYYTHGAGGNSPVTKGVISTNRRAVYLPDADIVCAGHIHEAWVVPITRTRLLQNGHEVTDEQTHIQIPTYKEEFLGANKGFHAEKEGPPKPVGAWWLRFWWDTKSEHIQFDTIRAK